VDEAERERLKKLYTGAVGQVGKLTERTFYDSCGMREDTKAPQLQVTGGASICPVMPRKDSQLAIYAATYEYYSAIGSPGLTGSGGAGTGRAARKSGKRSTQEEEKALRQTLQKYGECKTKGDQQEFFKERAKEVRDRGAERGDGGQTVTPRALPLT